MLCAFMAALKRIQVAAMTVQLLLSLAARPGMFKGEYLQHSSGGTKAGSNRLDNDVMMDGRNTHLRIQLRTFALVEPRARKARQPSSITTMTATYGTPLPAQSVRCDHHSGKLTYLLFRRRRNFGAWPSSASACKLREALNV